MLYCILIFLYIKKKKTSEAQRAALASSNSLFKDFQESLDALKAGDSDMVAEGLPLKTF